MCSEIGKWSEGFIIKKWLKMKEEAADNHIFSCTNNAVVRCSSEANTRMRFYKVKSCNRLTYVMGGGKLPT
jgi:hypothetical protein